MGTLTFKCYTGKVIDGDHTFDELYHHRCVLFIALARSNPSLSWISKCHDDGMMYDGWFIAGMHLPTGDISYHLPISMWKILSGYGIEIRKFAPKWDGHTANDTANRLLKWLGGNPEFGFESVLGELPAERCLDGDTNTFGYNANDMRDYAIAAVRRAVISKLVS